jgi:hypothetical protein
MRRLITTGLIIVAVGLWSGAAEAARTYTIAQTPVAPTSFPMGTSGTLTYRITNTNTGSNTGERIYEIRFRLPGTGTIFASSTAAPTGWTRTAYSTTSVTFRATSWANAIALSAYKDFPLNFTFRSTTADVNETLRDIRARYTTTTTGPPFTRLASVTTNNPGSWTLKALALTVQITDTSGTPITSLVAGNNYRVVMTVTNRSTTTQTSIVSVNNPPTQTASFTGAAPSYSSTVYSPNPLTLAAGASGTITFTYTTSATAYGTVSYTAYVRNNTGTSTSATVTSPTLYVGLFTATVTVTPASCLYSGQSFTVQMVLTNRYGFDITGVTASMAVSLVGAPLTVTSGPTFTPPSTTVTGSGGTLTVTWGYQVTSAANGQSFTFDGSAAGTGGGLPRTTSASSPSSKAGGYSMAAVQSNASSANTEISWAFQNNGCAATNSVSIDIPSGWTWGGGTEDRYSLVETGAATSVENSWIVSGSDPVAFTAPTVADRQAIGEDGDYRLAFSLTPTSTGASVFNVTITDANGYAFVLSSTATVNAFNFNGLNDAANLIWQEQFR